MKKGNNQENRKKSHIFAVLVVGMGCSLGVIFHNIPLFVGGGIVIGGLIEALS